MILFYLWIKFPYQLGAHMYMWKCVLYVRLLYTEGILILIIGLKNGTCECSNWKGCLTVSTRKTLCLDFCHIVGHLLEHTFMSYGRGNKSRQVNYFQTKNKKLKPIQRSINNIKIEIRDQREFPWIAATTRGNWL